MKVYIIGPMSGYPDFNYPAFAKAAEKWRKAGHTVFTPPEYNAQHFAGNTSHHPSVYIKKDIQLIFENEIEAVACLPRWHQSKGAKIEAAVAMMCGLRFFHAETLEEFFKVPRDIMVEAYE